MRYNYNYITADPGSGKTDWAIQYARRCVKMNPVLFVVPTKTLCDEIARRSGFIEAIHSGTCPGITIGQHIQEIMATVARTHQNRAIVITDAAYSHLRVRHDSWMVIKDEPDEPLTIRLLNCQDSWRFVNEHVFEFCIHPTNDAFYTLRVRRPLTYGMATELDSVFGALFELTEYLTQDSFYEVLVDRDAWDLTHTLRYSVFQRPECWANWGEVYFMGANFEDSLIYNQWRHQDVNWINRTPARLQPMPTDRITINYLFDDMAWSATSRARRYQGRTNLQWYLDWIRQELPTGNYVYVANNSLSDEQLALTGQRMPAECHGLNTWRDHTNCVLLGSYHQYQGDEMFYQYYKTSTADIRGMRNTQYYVQQLTRTNIRNYESTWPITVYVPTQREALDLLKYFREARIQNPMGQTWQLRPTWQPRPLLPDTQPTITGLTMGINTYADAVLIGEDHEIVNDTPAATTEPVLVRRRAGRPTDLSKGHPYLAFIVNCGQQIDLAAYNGTRDQFKRSCLPWFSPGIFHTGARMVKDNCLGAAVLGFDFDHALFTDRQLEEILRGVEHLIYTTISHDPGLSYRKLRVVVPLSRSISVSEHERLMAYYAWEFEKLNRGGLDESTLKAERKFYMPHAQADVKWVKKRKQPLNVDRLLLKIPKVALVQAPQPHDLVELINGQRSTTNNNNGLIVKINGIIDSMTAGDRSHKATRVGGMMRHLDADQRDQVWQRMRQKGVDDAALRSARKYAES